MMFRSGSIRLSAAVAPAIAAFISVSAHAADCATKVPTDSLLEPGKVQVSINPVSPPMQYVDSDGTHGVDDRQRAPHRAGRAVE